MKPGFEWMRRKSVVTVAVVLVVVAAGAAYLATKHRWASERLAELEPRYARLLGIEAAAPQLEAALVERRAAVARNAYPETMDVARAGSDAQQRARELFTRAGIEVTSTQLLPPKAVEGFDRIPMVFQLSGDLPALQAALTVLPSQSPALFVDGMSIQAAGTMRADSAQRLAVQANLFTLRARP